MSESNRDTVEHLTIFIYPLRRIIGVLSVHSITQTIQVYYLVTVVIDFKVLIPVIMVPSGVREPAK